MRPSSSGGPTFRAPMLRSLFVAALLAGAPGCGAETPTPKTPVGRSLPDDASRRPELPGPPGLPSSELLTLPDQSAPVVFAAGSQSGGLIAFVADGKIFARAVAASSDKAKADPEASKPVELGAARELGAFSLKPLADGGFVLFWDERVDQNHVFHLQRLGADAKPAGKALLLPPVAEAALSFSDVVVVGDRALVLYEVSKAGRASVFVTPIAAGLEKATGGARRWSRTRSRGMARSRRSRSRSSRWSPARARPRRTAIACSAA